MKIFSIPFFRLFILVAAVLAFIQCSSTTSEENPTPVVKSCSERGDSLAAIVGKTSANFLVVNPNGGEVFHLGDTLHITALSNLNEENAVLDMIYFKSGTVNVATLNPNEKSLNLYSNCQLNYVIPDSIAIGGSKISAIGDSVFIRARHYFNDRNDRSDAVFRILGK